MEPLVRASRCGGAAVADHAAEHVDGVAAQEVLGSGVPVVAPHQVLEAGAVLRPIGAISETAGVRVDGAPPERETGHGFDHFAG